MKCVKMRQNRVWPYTTTKNTKKNSGHTPNYLGSPHPMLKSWVRHCCAPVLKWKVGASAPVCHVTCVYIPLGSFCGHCKNVW